MKTREKILEILGHPVIYSQQLCHEIYNDFLAITGRVTYPNHMIFIAALPKSGSTWLEKLLYELPGFVKLNGSFLRSFGSNAKLQYTHGISEEMFNRVPKSRYSFVKLHTHYSDQYMRIMEEYNIVPTILIRDIRDMMISRYHHILADSSHWSYNLVKDKDFADGFASSLVAIDPEYNIPVISYYNDWIKNWHFYCVNNPSKALLVRYEDMKKDVHKAFNDVLGFYGISLSDEDLEDLFQRYARKHAKVTSLEKSLKLPSNKKNTFRKGKSGEWKISLNEEHKEIIKKHCGETLIKLNYEIDTNW